MTSHPKHPPRVFIIDASIFIFKYYFSMPPHWQSEDGRPTETVYGYLSWLLRFLGDIQPSHVVACFDESLGSCFRHNIFPDYKANRVLPDEALAFQLLACKKLTQLLGINCYASEEYEADDLIATFAYACQQDSIPYTVLSRDKDLGQLIIGPDNVLWYYPEQAPLTESDVQRAYSVLPQQIPDYLALVGDSADNIPGIPGVGKKTAAQLLKRYESWDEIKANLSSISELPIRGAASLQSKISHYSAQVDMARELTRLVTDAIDVSVGDTLRRDVDQALVKHLCEHLGLPERITTTIESIE